MIQGLQLIYRLRTTIRLLIDYRAGVDSFNLYYSAVEAGPYTSLGSVQNTYSQVPSIKGKIVFEFHTDSVVGWDNDVRNYIKLAPVIASVEGALEGPVMIPTRTESMIPKEFTVIYGLNTDSQKFIPISVDNTGKVMTV